MKKTKTKALYQLCRTGMIVLMLFMYLTGATKKVYAQENQYIGDVSRTAYLIKVNRVFNTITIYEKGEKGLYDKPVKAMLCSVGRQGTETPLGTYTTRDKSRWKLLMGDVWGQYATRIVKGVLFHSVYYYQERNPASLATRQYNKLGNAASHGCIRLSVGDAKWIYDNCAYGTTVVIYDDEKSAGPLGKPAALTLPASVTWDPTDPDYKNPYIAKKPTITGVKSYSVAWGSKVDLRKGVKAEASYGTDITSNLVVQGTVNPYMAGKYAVTYAVSDKRGLESKRTITVKVKESPEKPVFEGIQDQVVREGTVVNKTFALKEVTASCMGVPLKRKDIGVTIENISAEEYLITYNIRVGERVSALETAAVHVDKEAPVFSGITDRVMEPGMIPDQSFALQNITVIDNYSEMTTGDITVKIDAKEDGSFQITYEAQDEWGNLATETARFTY